MGTFKSPAEEAREQTTTTTESDQWDALEKAVDNLSQFLKREVKWATEYKQKHNLK